MPQRRYQKGRQHVGPVSYTHLIPASIDLSAAEVEIVGKIGREFILSDKLAPVVEGYDYIVKMCIRDRGRAPRSSPR